MADSEFCGNGLNKPQRKKARRKERKRREREAHRNLDGVTSEAVAEALRIAPLVVASSGPGIAIDVELASKSEAEFVRKRVNDALNVGEWLTDVRVSIWDVSEHPGPAHTERGAACGLELRIIPARVD